MAYFQRGRAVSEIIVYDKDDGHIVTASAQGDNWALLDDDGTDYADEEAAGQTVLALQINKPSTEQFFAMEGRLIVTCPEVGLRTVTQIESTMTYSILVRLQQ